MRICALSSAAINDERSAALSQMFALVRDLKAERILLFSALADAVLTQNSETRLKRDAAFVDDTARYLLSDENTSIPQRKAPQLSTFDKSITCVTRQQPKSNCNLDVTTRSIELDGKTICMSLPLFSDIEHEDLSNARIWIGGGDRVYPKEDLPLILAPGDFFSDGGGILVLDIDPRGIIIRWISRNKKEQFRQVFPFRAKSKMSVQG